MKFKQLLPFIQEHKTEFKVHCAFGSDDVYRPLKGYINGRFKSYQEDQTKKNFNRKYILSFVYYNKDEWLFVGVYESLGCKFVEETHRYKYDTKLLDIGNDLIGKAVIRFPKSFRASYLRLENHIDKMEVIEILRNVYKPKFPGYDKVNVSWQELSWLIDTDSWKTALEKQKAIYLITDVSNGKRYVGQASGSEMLYGRLKNYIQTGHGGNSLLKGLSFDYIKENFRYAILEIFKSTTDNSIINDREIYWKEVLLSRKNQFGYNDN